MNENIYIEEDYSETLIIKDKLIEEIQLIYCEFKENVSIINCKIQNASFQAAYFAKGLTIENSEFISEVDFSMGEHINAQSKFILEDVIFNNFVNFQDYAFRGKVIFKNVAFEKGTNIFGNKSTPVEVIFNIPPNLTNVKGILNKNDFK